MKDGTVSVRLQIPVEIHTQLKAKAVLAKQNLPDYLIGRLSKQIQPKGNQNAKAR